MRCRGGRVWIGAAAVAVGLVVICCCLPSWMWLVMAGAAMVAVGCIILKRR